MAPRARWAQAKEGQKDCSKIRRSRAEHSLSAPSDEFEREPMFTTSIEETGRTSMPMMRRTRPFVRVDGDADYYRRRAMQEQIAAQKATCEAARECHDQLAAMYRFRALMGSAECESGPEQSAERVLETVC